MVLTGTGWQPGESVSVYVNDDQNQTWSRTDTVTADAQGSIGDEFDLPNWFVATYTVQATGDVSGVVQTTFTDSAAQLEGQSNPLCIGSAGGCDAGWDSGNLSGWGETDLIPMRVKLTGGFNSEPFQISFDRSLNSSAGTVFGIESLSNFQADPGVTITTPTACDTTGTVWGECFSVSTTGTAPSTGSPRFITFSALMAVGAHNFTGSSMAIGGVSPGGLGNVQIAKPTIAQAPAGSPDLAVVKTCTSGCSATTGPNTATAGTTVTYRLDYSNLATTAANDGTTVVLRDVLDSSETFVGCSNTCADSGGSPDTLTWNLGSLPHGTSGFVTVQAHLTSTAGVAITNEGNIASPQIDSNPANNDSTLTTTTQSPPPNVDPTATSVSCAPNPVTYGASSSCTATVSDTAAGVKTAPTGTVTFNNGSASGSFSSATCTLGSPTFSSSSCPVTYTPTAVGTGTHTIGASYGTDTTHTGSSGSTDLTVQ
ncbi:MAG TPA: Ig-like domain repeat protein, partial [Solirubrobacteraceae bacterium]|nr:Ig-like domain repeat protein [Solirubrobacteraceae bacterium]